MEISFEEEADQKLKGLAEKLVNDLGKHGNILWFMGDGHGGYVFSVIQQTFYKRYGQPPKYEPDRCKKITPKTRRLVFERDAYRCVKCNSHLKLCVDHIYPWSLGGTDNITNLQTLCWTCNSKKSNKVEG